MIVQGCMRGTITKDVAGGDGVISNVWRHVSDLVVMEYEGHSPLRFRWHSGASGTVDQKKQWAAAYKLRFKVQK
jgi:hypothetical protein